MAPSKYATLPLMIEKVEKAAIIERVLERLQQELETIEAAARAAHAAATHEESRAEDSHGWLTRLV
mgnify:CR=1 FL=1